MAGGAGTDLGLVLSSSGKIELCVANSLWPQKDFKFLDEYLCLIEKFYDVSVTPVDYKNAVDEYNNDLSLNSLFYSNLNTYQILKPKKQLKINKPYLYESYAVFNDLSNNNTVVDANMASKNGTQKKNLKFISLATDVINELNTIIFSKKIKE